MRTGEEGRSLSHQPSALAPPNEIALSKQGGFFRSAYVVANFLLPRMQSSRYRFTQVPVKLGCQIPEQFCRNAFRHEQSLSSLIITRQASGDFKGLRNYHQARGTCKNER